jgi:hypothetical protein
MSETTPRARPRVRPALRRVAVAAFAVLVPVAAHGLWDYVEVRRLAHEIQRIIDRGEPVTLDYEPRPRSRPDAASYYIAGGILALGNAPFDELGPVRGWLTEPNPDRRMLEPLLGPLNQRVVAAEDALRLADAAAALPFEGYPPGTEFSYRVSAVWTLSELATARTLSLSAQGDGDSAVRSVLSQLKTERMETPFRIRGHQTAAVLSLSRPSPEALRQLQAALAAMEDPDAHLRVLIRERARYLEMAWRQYYGPNTTNPSHLTPFRRSVGERLMRPIFSRRLVVQLRRWSELLDIARRPWPARAAGRRAALDRRRETPLTSRNYLFSEDLALDAFGWATDPTSLIGDRASLTAVAIERYRRDHDDALPQALAALVPEYLASVPDDPFSGRDLLFRAGANAYTIYSIGPDLTDDGGELTRPAPIGSMVRRAPAGDIGVRVLLSAAR